MTKWELSQQYRLVYIWEATDVIQHLNMFAIRKYNKLKNENERIISIEAENAFDKIQHHFCYKHRTC